MAQPHPEELIGPHQPLDFPFPKWAFEKNTSMYRSCQASWFHSWTWLHYDKAKDAVLCHWCSKAVKERKLKPGTSDTAFVSSNYHMYYSNYSTNLMLKWDPTLSLVSIILQLTEGFSNWKDATVSFRHHKTSHCHKEVVERMLTLPATTHDIVEMLSYTLAKQKAKIDSASWKWYPPRSSWLDRVFVSGAMMTRKMAILYSYLSFVTGASSFLVRAACELRSMSYRPNHTSRWLSCMPLCA